MKKILLSISVLLALAIGFSACNKDDDAPPGKFTFDGKTFKLERAFSYDDGSDVDGDDTYYYWEIILTSGGITYDDTDEEFLGEGDAILLYYYVLNDDSYLPAGSFSDTEDNGYCDGFYVGYDLETGDGDYYYDFESVSFTVAKSGSTYTVTFNIELTGGGTVSGSYKGAIKAVS